MYTRKKIYKIEAGKHFRLFKGLFGTKIDEECLDCLEEGVKYYWTGPDRKSTQNYYFDKLEVGVEIVEITK